MKFSVYQISRKGGRDKNEDRMGYCYTQSSGLFVLADGMGGHPEGEVASQMTLQTVAALYQRHALPTLADPLGFLQDSFVLAHQQLLRYAASQWLSDTPRTTLVAFVLQGNHAYWAHCGDSRLYLIRDGKLMMKTRDHSYAEMNESSLLPENLAEEINRNVLFSCLGSRNQPIIDKVGPIVLQKGDRIVLCSDGLWGSVNDNSITEMLVSKGLADAVIDLVEQALINGGKRSDNVTVLAVEWESGANDDPPSVSTKALGNDVFASTIQATLSDQLVNIPTDVDALDEVEIERAIKEINEAIRRSSQLLEEKSNNAVLSKTNKTQTSE